MAENKLEGFEDFDNILGEGEGEGAAAGGAGDFAGELDDLLGEGGGGGEEAGAESPGEAAEGDSELDSFFEDLSTIDDLEVLQEEEPAPAAAEPAEEPEAEEEEEAPAPAAPVAAPAREKTRPARKPREKKKRGFFGRLFRWIILLAILLGGGYFIYNFFFPDMQPPWEVMEQGKQRVMSVFEERMKTPPPAKPTPPPAPEPLPPPPPVVRRPAPRPKAPPKPRPQPEHGPWSIQVATCFFPSCLDSFRSYLEANQRSVLVRQKNSESESLEIYSISTWRERDEAQHLADRINREHPLEGHAFILREGGGYRISMGAFADLGRANVVKDALNQQYRGEIGFASRVKAFPYKLQSVMTGRYPTREAAERALNALRDAEPRLKDAFVTRNR